MALSNILFIDVLLRNTDSMPRRMSRKRCLRQCSDLFCARLTKSLQQTSTNSRNMTMMLSAIVAFLTTLSFPTWVVTNLELLSFFDWFPSCFQFCDECYYASAPFASIKSVALRIRCLLETFMKHCVIPPLVWLCTKKSFVSAFHIHTSHCGVQDAIPCNIRCRVLPKCWSAYSYTKFYVLSFTDGRGNS